MTIDIQDHADSLDDDGLPYLTANVSEGGTTIVEDSFDPSILTSDTNIASELPQIFESTPSGIFGFAGYLASASKSPVRLGGEIPTGLVKVLIHGIAWSSAMDTWYTPP